MPNYKLILLFWAFGLVAVPIQGQNDKQVLGDAVFTPLEIEQGVDVIFLIRFQNLGIDTANNIAIRDTLDPRFDANTFQMIDASHDYQLLRDQGFVRWYFNGIRLPANHQFGADNSNSTGFILYTVQPLRFLEGGQNIQNRACITFDDDAPLCTNNATIWIDEGAIVQEPEDLLNRSYKIVPNPNHGYFSVQKSSVKSTPPGESVTWWISDMNGKTILDGSAGELVASPNEVMLERPAPGLYMLWMKENGQLRVEQFAVIR